MNSPLSDIDQLWVRLSQNGWTAPRVTGRVGEDVADRDDPFRAVLAMGLEGEAVEILLDAGIRPRPGDTPLLRSALKKGLGLDTLKRLAAAADALPLPPGFLHGAMRHVKKDALAWFVGNGVDINWGEGTMAGSLMAQALDQGNTEVAFLQAMLGLGANPNGRKNTGLPVFMAGFLSPGIDRLKLFARAGADFSLGDEEGQTLLHRHWISFIDPADPGVFGAILPVLEKSGLDVNRKDWRGRTVAMVMVLSGLDNIYHRPHVLNRFDQLLQCPRVRVDVPDRDGRTLADHLDDWLARETRKGFGEGQTAGILRSLQGKIAARQVMDARRDLEEALPASGGPPAPGLRLRL